MCSLEAQKKRHFENQSVFLNKKQTKVRNNNRLCNATCFLIQNYFLVVAKFELLF